MFLNKKEGNVVSRLRVHSFSISIEGYGAGPSQDLENSLGAGGPALFEWFFHTRTWQRMHGKGYECADMSPALVPPRMSFSASVCDAPPASVLHPAGERTRGKLSNPRLQQTPLRVPVRSKSLGANRNETSSRSAARQVAGL